MQEDLAKKRLGRGLSALIGEMNLSPVAVPTNKTVNNSQAHFVDDAVQNKVEEFQSVVMQAPLVARENPTTSEVYLFIETIAPNPHNPRQEFLPGELDDLACSIQTHGVIQPIIVRAKKNGHFSYELIAGERRWRAAGLIGLQKIPAIIKDIDDREALEFAIVENIQRSDLNAVEEALGYQKLIEEYEYTQMELAQAMAKSRSYIANSLRLLRLPEQILSYVRERKLSAGHARALVVAADPLFFAEKVIKEQLSVRQLEMLMQEQDEEKVKKQMHVTTTKNDYIQALEDILNKAMDIKVLIKHHESGKGQLRLQYQNLQELERLCQRLQN